LAPTSKHLLASAFASEAAISAVDDLITALTENGDVTFGAMGHNTPSSALLQLDQKMVRDVSVTSRAPTVTRAHGRGRVHVAHHPKPGHHTKPVPVVISDGQRALLDTNFDAFVTRVSSLAATEQVKWWSLMFRYLFYLRNVRGEGKRERLLFYYLFEKVHTHYPKTAEALVSLIPGFGYFGDLDHLITEYRPKGDSGKGVVDAAVTCYITFLNADSIQVFGKPLSSVSLDEADELNARLKAMTADEVSAFVKGKKLSLAAKWFKREGKKDSENLDLFVEQLYPMPGNAALKVSDPVRYAKRVNYSMMRLRKAITAITQCLGVAEQMMCAKPDEAGDITRDWSDIDMERAPAGFATKYRKALLNESLTEGVTSETLETGNRSKRDDRIECRKHTLQAILDGKLKGANQDLSKLSELVMSHVVGAAMYGNVQFASISTSLTMGERSFIAQQWRDLVKAVKEMVEETVAAHADDVDYIDPRNVIPIVDTSGSMSNAHVQDKAIGLGLLATAVSNLPGCMISFSDEPKVFNVDLTKDVFDQFLEVCRGPTGLNTNVDATYRLALDLMVKHSVPKTDFALLYLTDGQFDSGLVHFDEDVKSGWHSSYAYGYGYSYGDTRSRFQDIFLGRMEKAFQEKGYTLPRTIFWNLNGTTGNYMAAEDTKGVQMVSGFSQTLMKQVFTGDFVLTTDEATGAVRVKVDPWTSFLKVLTSDTFTPILHKVLATKEGVFGTLA
jgi:hypothetical protein